MTEFAEPPERGLLRIGDKIVPFDVGEPFELEFGGQKHPASIEIEPTRQFRVGGLSFEYPREMDFDFCDGQWRLSRHGGSVTFSLSCWEDIEPGEVLEDTLDRAREVMGDAREAPFRPLDLGGVKVWSSRLDTEIDYFIELHSFKSTDGVWLFEFSGGLEDSSEAWAELLLTLERTFRLS